jgi:hypothetical protein
MFRSDPRDNGVKVLLSVDEDSYKGQSKSIMEIDGIDDGKTTGNYPGHGTPHPIGMSEVQ